MPAIINVLGLIFSVYFYTWLHPDLNANVRIGLNRFKVDCTIYIGTVLWMFLAMCIVAPYYTRRTNALVGNIGMAVCSVVVILAHYLLENKWVWSGLLYICDILLYAFFLGLALMGQASTYYYDRRRVINLSIPAISNIFVTWLLASSMQETKYNDLVPCVSFGVHTSFAILAQVAGPRCPTWDFFEYFNNKKKRR